MDREDRLQVSIVVPVYRAEKYIAKCIESILKQTYDAFELILVDDGSPDRSGSICDEYARRDSRIKVIHTPNGGVSNARNTGIDNASGEYLMFVDSDDWVSPEYIQNLLPVDDEDMVHSGCVTVVDGQFTERLYYSPHVTEHSQWKDNFCDCWANGAIMPPWGNCYKRRIIQEQGLRFLRDIDISEDEIFNLQYINFCNRVRYTDKCDYYYTIDKKGSLMNRHHPCRTLSLLRSAQAKEQLTGKPEYHIRWGAWCTAVAHHSKWLKISKGQKKKEIRKCLKDSYRNSYFRESILYIRKNGTLDEKVETFFMHFLLHPMYPGFYKVIVWLSRLKRH